MKPVTHAKRRKIPRIKRGLLLLLLIPLLSCQREQEAAASPEISLRIAHLHDYAWLDREQSGQPVDMKPPAEREALQREFGDSPADLLVLRGLGSRAALEFLQRELAENVRNYPHLFYAPGADVYQGVGFLSTLPFSGSRELSGEVFRIREQQFQPLAGGVSIATPAFPKLWIWNQQAPAADTGYERRRNEARILAQTLRPLVRAGEEVLLTLHSREEADSPMFRMLEEAGLRRLVPVDGRGDSWTHRDPEGILYRQDQWLFASPALHARINEATVFDSGDLRLAGPYRHQGLRIP